MNRFVNLLGRYARLLPDDFVFGATYRAAKSVNRHYLSTSDPLGYIQEYQNIHLHRILKLAENLPYYRQLGLHLNVDRFEQIHFVNKAVMQQDIYRFRYSERRAVYGTTGGTTGKPFGFYINKNRKGVEWYWMTENWKRVGFDRRTSYRAVLRNHIIGSKEIYKMNSFLKEYDFSNYNITDTYLAKVVKIINSRKIEYVHAYPSAAHRLTKYLLHTGDRLPTIKAFLCGSENIYPDQRQDIEANLGIRIYSWYGHSEKLILAGECENHNYYHAIPFYGYAELIGVNGKRISREGARGELVGTGFINTKMPFVRYRTGDFATYVGDQCPHCGRYGLIFRDVKGRWDGEKIYSSNGTYVTTTALNMHSDVYQNVKAMQYYQDTPGILEMRLVTAQDYSKNDERRIHRELLDKLGDDIQITLIKVEELDYTQNRKYRLLIQKIIDYPSS